MKTASRSAIAGLLLGGAALVGLSAPASAATYNYVGVITACTGTCNSFAALDVGTEITGTYEINTTANGAWTFADVGAFGVLVNNPNLPFEAFDGTNPTTATELPLDNTIAPIVPADAFGNFTGGTTDAGNELLSGNIFHEFVVPPFSDNGAWVIFDLVTGGAQVCIAYSASPCIPFATEVAIIDGTFSLAATTIPVPAAAWLFGSALLGLLGLRRRK